MQGRQVLSHSSRLKAAMRRQLRQTPTSVPLILQDVHILHAMGFCHKCHGARRVRTCEEQSAELLTVTPHHTEPNTQFNSRNTKIPQWRWEIVFVKTVSRQQTGCAPFETYPVINNCASVKICCCPSHPGVRVRSVKQICSC